MTDAIETPATADVLQPAPEGRAWVVVHARPRAEKKITLFCRTRDYPSYLPLRDKTHMYGKRKRTFSSPLFTGYVFCCVDQPGKSLLRHNDHVANVLEVVDQTGLIAQLRQIRTAIAAGQVVEVLPYLEPGKRILITTGPMRGLEGVVVRLKGKTRIIISVEMIQQSVVTEVDGEWLGPA